MCDDYNGGDDIGGGSDISDVSDVGNVTDVSDTTDDSAVLDGLEGIEETPAMEDVPTDVPDGDDDVLLELSETEEEVSPAAAEIDENTGAVDQTPDTDKTPMQEMTDYMSSHNYGQGDYPEYSQDPEYQAINDRLLEQEGRPPADYSEAGHTGDPMQEMTDYMSSHNYGQGDYPEYSQDPEYQAINDRLLEQEGRPPADYSAVSGSLWINHRT